MVNALSVRLGDWVLDNPIIPASGTFGFGYEFADSYDLNLLGSISLKGTTLQPRFGNPTPRIAETPSGMLNAVGLQNPGVKAVIQEELPKLKAVFHKKLIANINGFSIDEFVRVAEAFDQEESIAILELNISCPNVKKGGMAFGTSPLSARSVVETVKDAVSKPVFVKLSPNVTDIAELAKACEDGGADGISLINTLLGMRIDIRKRSPLLANRTGGSSGPAVFPVALRMVYQVFEAVKLPIIGMGGIDSPDRVVEMMMAGASAVQIGAANLIDPLACKKIIDCLPGRMRELGIENLSSIIGCAHPPEE